MGRFQKPPRAGTHLPIQNTHGARRYTGARGTFGETQEGRAQFERQFGAAPSNAAGTNGGPHGLDLEGDTRMAEHGVGARSAQELDAHRVRAVDEDAFSNPAHNVPQFGLREGMTVADFGSGTGAYAIALARAVGESGTVYAVDVQRDLLTRLQNMAVQENIPNIEVLWGTIDEKEGSHIKSGLLDLVLIANTLFQVDNKIATIQEAYRVLKDGGALAVIDWSDSWSGLGPPKDAVVTSAEAMLVCTDNGFSLKKHFPAGDHHYGLLFTKHAEGATQDEKTKEAVREATGTQKDFISRTIAQELV